MSFTASGNARVASGWSLTALGNNGSFTVDVPSITYGSATQSLDWSNYYWQYRTFTALQASRASLSWKTILCENCGPLILDLINPALILHSVPIDLELPFENKIFQQTAQYTYRCNDKSVSPSYYGFFFFYVQLSCNQHIYIGPSTKRTSSTLLRRKK